MRLLASRRTRITLLTLLGVLVVFRLGQVVVAAAGPAWGYDFSAYWLAGRNVLDGEPLYTSAQLAGPYQPQQPSLYLYPPFFAVAIAPLSALVADARAATLIWALAGAFLLVVSIWALCRAAGLTTLATAVIAGAAVALPPVGFELVMGNTHLLLAALFAGAWLGVRRQTVVGEGAAGVLIGIAVLIKLFPAVIVIWFILTGRWRAAVAATVSAAALTAVTIPFVGVEAWLSYPQVVANLGPPLELWSSLAPTALLAEFVSFPLARVIVTILGLVLLVWSARAQATVISFAVAVMVSLLVTPTLYPHYLAVEVVPLALGVIYGASGLLSSLAYVALFVGGQLALIDLRALVFRLIAFAGANAPLAPLIAERRTAGHNTHEEAVARG